MFVIDQTDTEICDSCNCPCHSKCGYPNGDTLIRMMYMVLRSITLISVALQLLNCMEKQKERKKERNSQSGPIASGKSEETLIKHGNLTKSQSVVIQYRPANKKQNEQSQKTDKSELSSQSQTNDNDLMKNIKLADLMNKEAKLKKWEGDLKLKDTIHSEQNKERLKLETYTMKQKRKKLYLTVKMHHANTRLTPL